MWSFPAGFKTVKISTTLAATADPKTDLDLTILLCSDQDSSNCKPAGSSGNATSDETVTIPVTSGSYFLVRVNGYAIPDADKADYLLSLLLTNELESYPTKLQLEADDSFGISSTIAKNSPYLNSDYFETKGFDIIGDLRIRNTSNQNLLRIPVKVQSPSKLADETSEEDNGKEEENNGEEEETSGEETDSTPLAQQ